MSPPTSLRALDDRTAFALLASLTGPRSRFAPAGPLATAAPAPADLRAALDTAFGELPLLVPASEGDLARAALVLAAEDPAVADALTALLDHGVPQVMGARLRDSVGALAFAILQSHLKVDLQIPGVLTFHLEKPPAPDSAVLGVARALQACLPPAPARAPASTAVPAPTAVSPPRPSASPSRPSVFVARAPADAAHAADLKKALAPWLHRDAFQWWSEDNLTAGDPTTSTVQSYLEAAHLLLLLVTPDLLASLPHWKQLQRALDRHRDGTARVVPILVRPSAWTETGLADLQPVPQNKRFVTSWENPDEAWLSVVQDLQALL